MSIKPGHYTNLAGLTDDAILRVVRAYTSAGAKTGPDLDGMIDRVHDLAIDEDPLIYWIPPTTRLLVPELDKADLYFVGRMYVDQDADKAVELPAAKILGGRMVTFAVSIPKGLAMGALPKIGDQLFGGEITAMAAYDLFRAHEIAERALEDGDDPRRALDSIEQIIVGG